MLMSRLLKSRDKLSLSLDSENQDETNKTQKTAVRWLNEKPGYYNQPVEDCLRLLNTRFSGLDTQDALTRRAAHGYNRIDATQFKSTRQLFLQEFNTLGVYLLFAAGLLSFYTHSYIDAIFILGAMILYIGLHLTSQLKAQEHVAELHKFSNTFCTVRRNGQAVQLSASEIVPGDILILTSGQIVPADARLFSSKNLQVDESFLTGESVLVFKEAEAILEADTEICDQRNMVFAGTRIKTGRAEAIVIATGEQSFMGKIARQATRVKRRETPMTRGLNRMVKFLYFLVLLSIAVVSLMEFQRGATLTDILKYAVVLMVAAMPENLTAIATYVFSLGIERLMKENILVKNLQAFEAIGRVNVICTDKTGTLTENSMTLSQLYVPCLEAQSYDPAWKEGTNLPAESLKILLQVARLNNTTIADGIRSQLVGDPIDTALYRATSSIYEIGLKVVAEDPFDPVTLRSAVITKTKEGDYYSFIKGSPEAVLNTCSSYMRPDGEIVPMTTQIRDELCLINQDLALVDALRVIGFARKTMANDHENPYKHATFIGFISLEDPLRPGVKQAILESREAGVNVVMVTGDQKATAAMIARKLGIITPEESGTMSQEMIWTRRDLSDHGTEAVPESVRVFARTKPEEKLGIVESLQNSGKVVAMVGDGVNDIPALQKSDIAIAMGNQGADAAKESADMILMNDRFEGIVFTILESRILNNNIKLCVEYLLSCHFTLFITLVFSAMLNLGLLLSPLQILWLNIFVVIFPALSLGFSPPTASVLRQAPVTSGDGSNLLSPQRNIMILFWSVVNAAAALTAYYVSVYLLEQPAAVATTIAFSTIAFALTLNVLNVQLIHARDGMIDYLEKAIRVPILWVVMLLVIALQVEATYMPSLMFLLKTTFIPPQLWLVPVGLSVTAVFVSLTVIDGNQLD